MKHLLKVILIIGAIFATTFIIVRFTGVLTIEQIEGWLELAKQASAIHVGLVVVALLFIDLFIAVPTLTVIMLSGFFLGQWLGPATAISGLMMAGICGYLVSRHFGEKILSFVLKDEAKRTEMKQAFLEHGFIMILLSRAVPILPEVTACLAGITKMPFKRFLLAWTISTVPYASIAAYSGSISTLNDPSPAIITAIALWAMLWFGWFMFKRTWRG